MRVNKVIGIDCNGGDFIDNNHPSKRIIEGVSKYQKIDSDSLLFLYGDKSKIEEELSNVELVDSSRIHIVDAPYYFESYKTISKSPGNRGGDMKETSLIKLVNALKENKLDVGVSMHETKAMLLWSRKFLGLVENLDIPAPPLMTFIPTTKGKTLLTDVGSTTDTTPYQLSVFGILSSEYLKVVEGIDDPVVKLIANGTETMKGSGLVRKTAELLDRNNYEGKLNFDRFYPYVEPHTGLFKGHADIALTDGHTGNLLIKFAKGFKDLGVKKIESAYDNKKGFRDNAAFLGLGVTKAFYKGSVLESAVNDLNPASYNGAPLLGLNNYFIKLQGNSSSDEVVTGILNAKKYADSGIIPVFRDVFQ